MALVSAFVENFDTFDTTTKWDTGIGPGATCAIVNGRLRMDIPTTATYNRVFSRDTFDLTDSSAFVQLVTPMTVSPAQDGPDCGFVLHVGNWGDGNNWFGWSLDAWGQLHGLKINSFNPTILFSLTYSAATHKWLRIRADTVKVYFDTAPATASNPPVSSDWVQRGEILQSALGMSIGAVHPQLYISSWANTTGDPTYVEWDGLNTVAGADTAIIPTGWDMVYSRNYASLGSISLNAGLGDSAITSDTGEVKPAPFRYRNWSTVGLSGFAYDVYIDPFASGLPAEYLIARPLGEIEPIPGVGIRLHSKPMTGPDMRAVVNSQFPDAMSKAAGVGQDPWLTATIGTYIKIAATPPFARETYFIPRNSTAQGMWSAGMWSVEDGNRAWPNDTLHKPFEYDDHEFLGRGASGEYASVSIHAYKTIAFDQPAMHETIGDYDPASVGLSNFVNQKIGVRTIFDTGTIKTYYNINDGDWTHVSSVNVSTQLAGTEYLQYHIAFQSGCGAGIPWLNLFPSVPLAMDIVSTALYAPASNTQVRVPASSQPGEVLLTWRNGYGTSIPVNTPVGTAIADLSFPSGVTSASVITYGGRLSVVGTELRIAGSGLNLSDQPTLRFHIQGMKPDGAKSIGRQWSTSVGTDSFVLVGKSLTASRGALALSNNRVATGQSLTASKGVVSTSQATNTNVALTGKSLSVSRGKVAGRVFGWTNPLVLTDYGAVGDGSTNNLTAINNAIAAARTQHRPLLVPNGTFAYNGVIHLDSVALIGLGAGSVLHALDYSNTAIYMEGVGPAVYNVKLTSVAAPSRMSAWSCTKITAFGCSGFTIHSVRALGSSAASFQTANGAGYGYITNCTISDSWADSVHMTDNAHDIEVSYNTITNSGDDGIAVVSYWYDSGRCNNIVAHHNTISNNVGGRGMTVVGGNDVWYYQNKVADNTVRAGIYIVQEGATATGATTRGCSRILVENNTVLRCGSSTTGHTGIFTYSDGYEAVDGLTVRRNDVDQTGSTADGIRYFGTLTNVLFDQNRVTTSGTAYVGGAHAGVTIVTYSSGTVGQTEAIGASYNTGALVGKTLATNCGSLAKTRANTLAGNSATTARGALGLSGVYAITGQSCMSGMGIVGVNSPTTVEVPLTGFDVASALGFMEVAGPNWNRVFTGATGAVTWTQATTTQNSGWSVASASSPDPGWTKPQT